MRSYLYRYLQHTVPQLTFNLRGAELCLLAVIQAAMLRRSK
jgi:hypothetical protein